MKKRKNVFATITLVSVFLFLSFIPFMHTLNYSGFEALGVSISPSQKYIINYDLPHIKPVNASVREKARKSLCKTFGISSSNENGKYDITKPMVFLFKSPVSNKYYGNIEIGNIKANFTKIKVISEEKQTSEQNPKGKDLPPSKVLLTCYFTLNEKPLRANIFLMNEGSFLRYSSMTIQDKNDNVLAMFTFGKAPLEKGSSEKSPKTKAITTNEGSGGWETEEVLKHQIKYITINDPVGNMQPATVPALRLDAISNRPFNNSGGANNYLAARSWLFGEQIAAVYKNFFVSAGYGDVYAYPYVNSISNTIWQRFPSEINKSNVYPEETGYSTIPIEISFDLKFVSVGYTIHIPYGGVKRTWTLENTFNHTSYQCNYGKFSALPYNTFVWNDKNLFWNSSVYDAMTNDSPGSSYGGFYSRYETALYAYGDYLYANYSSEIDCGIKVVSAKYDVVDYYYISVSETFPYVNLAG